MSQLQTTVRDDAAAVMHALEPVSELNGNSIRVLFAAASNPGISLYELQRMTQIPRATISRLVLDLSGHARGRQQALNLITSRTAATDLRRKEYDLTPEGRRLVALVCQRLRSRFRRPE